MKCKIFNIRLQKDKFTSDESKLNDFLENVQLKNAFASLVQHPALFWSILIFYQEKENIIKDEEFSTRPLTEQEEIVFANLKKWRFQKALEEGAPTFAIAHNASLIQMIQLPVKTIEDFKKIKGFGEKRTQKFGNEILEIVVSGLLTSF